MQWIEPDSESKAWVVSLRSLRQVANPEVIAHEAAQRVDLPHDLPLGHTIQRQSHLADIQRGIHVAVENI